MCFLIAWISTQGLNSESKHLVMAPTEFNPAPLTMMNEPHSLSDFTSFKPGALWGRPRQPALKKGKWRIKENIMQEHDADCSTGPAENFCGNVAFFRPKNAPLLEELNPSFALVSSQIIAFVKEFRLRKNLCMCKCMQISSLSFLRGCWTSFLTLKQQGGGWLMGTIWLPRVLGLQDELFMYLQSFAENQCCVQDKEKSGVIYMTYSNHSYILKLIYCIFRLKNKMTQWKIKFTLLTTVKNKSWKVFFCFVQISINLI